MKRRRRFFAPRPLAPDSLPAEATVESERAERVNELLSSRGLERPEIDAWWGTRLEENEGRSRTELWADGAYDAVERQARGDKGEPRTS